MTRHDFGKTPPVRKLGVPRGHWQRDASLTVRTLLVAALLSACDEPTEAGRGVPDAASQEPFSPMPDGARVEAMGGGEVSSEPVSSMPNGSQVGAMGGGEAVSEGGAQASTTPGAPGEATEEPIAQGDAANYALAKSLVGDYAAKITYRDLVTIGLAGEASMLTKLLAVAQVRDNPLERRVELSMQLCSSVMGMMVQKHLPDLLLFVPENVLALVNLAPAPLSVAREGGQLTWQTGELFGPVGFHAATSAEALPASASDPRVVDADEDGQPGVSAALGGEYQGALYLAMAYRFTFAGLVDDGTLKGSTTSLSRESLLGSELAALNDQAMLREADANRTDNEVVLVRTSPGLDCANVIAQSGELF